MISASEERNRVNDALAHLLALARAADYVLREFGDEYEGRLSPLREAVEAYDAWVRGEPTDSPSEGPK